MSRKPKTWLHTALRAQQARTSEEAHRMHEARTEAEVAQVQAQASAAALLLLSEEWRRSRGHHIAVGELDALYQRFHGHLHRMSNEHAQVQQAKEQVLMKVEQRLQQHHALERALETTLERRTAAVVKSRLELERQSTAEAWLMNQCNKEKSR